MSKRNLTIATIAVLGLIGGFVYFNFNKSSQDGNSDNSSGVIGSIKDVLNKDVTLSCEFNDQDSNFKSYIKNGAVRVTTIGKVKDQSGEMLMKDGKMYIWDLKTNEGFVTDIPKNEDGSSQEVGMTAQNSVSSEAYLDLIDKYKDSCKVTAVEDSLFVVPANIDFKDMSKLFEELQQYQMPQAPADNY